MKAIKELKLRLPAERKAKGHSSTLNALKYALQCVRQVGGEVLLLTDKTDSILITWCGVRFLISCMQTAVCKSVFSYVQKLSDIFLIFAANKEYYHQWSVEECHGCSLDLSTFTIEELDNITSEYTLKNTVSPDNVYIFPNDT